MKRLGYLLFAVMFYICRIFPIKENCFFLMMTHDPSKEGNIGAIRCYLEESQNQYEFVSLTREQEHFRGKAVIKRLFVFFFKKPYEMATSHYILMDNVFLPMAYMKFSKKVKVVQLWHGTGTIKKFGQHVNQGTLGQLEKKANQCITHLIVNGEDTKELYQGCFGVTKDKVYVTGLPRTDLLFQEEKKEKALKQFYQQFPQYQDKKIILYAPTFRDSELEHPRIPFQGECLLEGLGEEYILGLRLHPHVANRLNQSVLSERVVNFSNYPDLNSLLFAADILITDYSSIIFEFCALQKPMIFYAYDLDEFSENGRGFYHPYKEYVPGPVAENEEELRECLRLKEFDKEKVNAFFHKSYAYEDGGATKRVVDLLLEEKKHEG